MLWFRLDVVSKTIVGCMPLVNTRSGVPPTGIPLSRDKVPDVTTTTIPDSDGLDRVCADCTMDFKLRGRNQWSRKSCYDCKPPLAERYPDTYDVSKQYTNVSAKVCELKGCQRHLPAGHHAAQKYCTKAHAQQAASTRQTEKKKAVNRQNNLFKSPDLEEVVAQERQGHIFDVIKSDPILREQLESGEVTATAVAVANGWTTAGVTRAMHAMLAERAIESQRAEWSQSKRTMAMLPSETWFKVRGMSSDDPEFEGLIDELVRAYTVFSKRHFTLEGRRPLIKRFHVRWIRSIIEAAATGGKQLILSPPRHGKSETLIRFVVWFICMDPNIRIGWFCASRDVAELMIGAVKDIFENNEQLIKDVLPPGELFDPGLKSGKKWSAKEIKVAQQTHVGAKSSSLLALGRTSKFLSRDMDLIVIDDLEDYDSTREEGQRIYSRNKLAEIGTRKVEETAEVYIGSRQHPDDIPNLILELEDTILQWKVIVNSAHDEYCDLDPEAYDEHIDCMLFPEVRSYRYLMEKKLEMETLGLAHLYPLRYLNTAVPQDGQVFDMALVREHALDKTRGIGLGSDDEDWKLPLGRLAAGLDPSARGIQAAFLWHYANGKMSAVDVSEQQSGGQEGAIRIIREWFHEYSLTLWFYETNSMQIDFYDNIKKQVQTKPCHICNEPHPEIQVKDHNTSKKNKRDAELGISAMAPRYHDGRISIPAGTNHARRKFRSLLRQLELWTTDGVIKKNVKTDVKMAQWFPFEYILRLEKQDRALTLNHDQGAAYPGYTGNDAPWGNTMYPGGG